jgi:hypothetical protein
LLEPLQVTKEGPIFFESVRGPPTHEINLTDPFQEEKSYIRARAAQFSTNMGSNDTKLADIVRSGSLPGVD